jgi:hypothetical protein
MPMKIRSWFIMVVIFLAIAVICGGVSFAQTPFGSIPVSFTVVQGVKEVKVFSDDHYSQVITSLELGNIGQGERVTKDIYVMNTGKASVCVMLKFTGDMPWGTIIVQPYYWEQLDPGNGCHCVVTVVTNPNAPLNSYSISLDVTDCSK